MDLPKALYELEYDHGSIYGPEEEAALHEVLAASAPSCGAKVKQFEEAFAAYCGVPYGLAVTSATAGLQLAMIAAGVGRAMKLSPPRSVGFPPPTPPRPRGQPWSLPTLTRAPST